MTGFQALARGIGVTILSEGFSDFHFVFTNKIIKQAKEKYKAKANCFGKASR